MRERNRMDFARSLFFNYLMMAPDAHAKNYSVLLLADAVRLAPLYDIASGAPYTKDYGRPGFKRAAMRIGGENQFGELSPKNLQRFAQRNGFEEQWVMETFKQMAEGIPSALENVFACNVHITGTSELREAMLGRLSSHCQRAGKPL